MNFYVVVDEDKKTVYDFRQQDFISAKDVNQNCIMPSLTFAIKVTKHPYLFLRINHTGKLKAKMVKVEGFSVDIQSDTNENEKKLEVSWC